ncbi:MAG: Shedu anti-phage system protein SduA domain-containing protein [Gammaproteobacteria bacterium]
MVRPSQKLAAGAKRPSFKRYAARVKGEFRALLSSEPKEDLVHAFLERHPALVPGALTPSGTSGHYPLHCALITKPVLPGFHSHEPDFMWIASHSGTWFPTLIEIERPSKRLFTKSGQPRAEFTQARTQLAQWRSWFQSPTNVQQFMDLYGLPPEWREFRSSRLHMILIYGRREEFATSPRISKLRSSLMPSADEELMSFDRLKMDPNLEAVITVRVSGDARFHAVWVPQTFGTSAAIAESLLSIDGLTDAMDQNEQISEARRAFLKDRIKYWREWSVRPGIKRFSLSLD